ncbi:MAG: hypothetical protein JXL67_00880, partial [Calditrichaeota bacterium]|nr:hypothetical protein [Calditrichota bacterium]
LRFVEISPTTTEDAKYSLSLNVSDLEVALQIAAAKVCQAEMILTRNIKHYKDSPVLVQTPEIFLKSWSNKNDFNL